MKTEAFMRQACDECSLEY